MIIIQKTTARVNKIERVVEKVYKLYYNTCCKA